MSRLNLKADSKTQEYLLAYLEANASESLAERINVGKKTLAGAMSYLTDWAKKTLKPKGGVAGAPDDVVFGQLIHYFEEDSLDFEKKDPVAEVKAAPAAAAPVKAKGRRTKVAVASVPVDEAKISSTVDELLADCGIAVAEEKPAEPGPKPEPEEDELDKAINKHLLHVGEETPSEPEAPPAPEERKEPQQMDWLVEFGVNIEEVRP